VERTKEQLQAITTHGTNVLVAAAAGSGKTSVLIERLERMITDLDHPVDLDHLLVVTFTNAAAAQMRERMEAALEKRLLQAPMDQNLHRQMLLLRHSHIMTIDSFCAEILRNHFQSVGLDPSFRIADAAELKLLQEDVLTECLEQAYDREDEDFLLLSDSYAPGKSDAALEEMIRSLAQAASAYPDPEKWLDEQKERIQENASGKLDTDWMKRLLEYKDLELGSCLKDIEALLMQYGKTEELLPYMKAVEEDASLITLLMAKKDYKSFAAVLKDAAFARLGRLKKAAQEEYLEAADEIKSVRSSVKNVIGSIQKQFLPAGCDNSDSQKDPAELLKSDLVGLKRPMMALISITRKFIEAFRNEKQKRAILDFSDQEHLALQILKGEDGHPSAVAKEYKQYFQEIFIDEYQDSNRLQEEILNAVSHGNNIFMVGDVKQSIYKFRLARPELFVEKYAHYIPVSEDRKIEYSTGCKIDLGMNFRSRETVLSTVNFLFSRIMQPQLGKIDYDKKAALYYGLKDGFFENPEDFSEMIVIAPVEDSDIEENNPEEKKKNIDKEKTKIELEAEAVAGRILQLMEQRFSVQDKNGSRPAGFGDIVVLLRTMSGWSEVFLQVFSQSGIPAQASTGTGYFEAMEVKCMLNLLRLIGNEQQDIALAAVMLSKIGGFNEDELALIRAGQKVNGQSSVTRNFYHICSQYLEDGADELLKQKLADFRQMISDFREKAEYLSVPELLEEILLTTGYDHSVRAMPDGEKRYANICMLLKKASDFEKTSYHGLFQFNRYMERLKKYEVDFGEAVQASTEGMVRIMSIHKSKGLEFPIVFVCGLGKQFNKMDARKSVVIHPEYGIGADYVDLETHTKVPTVLKKFLQKDLTAETVAEELRVLYVAMTRASEKLIMTGFLEHMDEKKRIWKQQGRGGRRLSFSVLCRASGFLDIIMPVFLGAQDLVEYTGFDELPLRITYHRWEMAVEEGADREMGRMLYKQELSQKMRMGIEPADTVFLGELRKELNRQLSWKYQYLEAAEMKTKFTVTELKKAAMEEIEDTLLPPEDREPYIPSFLSAQNQKESNANSPRHRVSVQAGRKKVSVVSLPYSGARIGTLYHRFLQYLDFSAENEADIASQMEKMVQLGLFTPQESGLIYKKKIWELIQSPLGARICAAQKEGRLFREQPFVMGVPAGRFFPQSGDLYEKEQILVQGVIDLFFEEDGQIILVDYKTDRVHSMEELKKRYQIQLDYYAEVLEKGREMKCKEKYLYSFALGESALIGRK